MAMSKIIVFTFIAIIAIFSFINKIVRYHRNKVRRNPQTPSVVTSIYLSFGFFFLAISLRETLPVSSMYLNISGIIVLLVLIVLTKIRKNNTKMPTSYVDRGYNVVIDMMLMIIALVVMNML